MRPVTLTFSGLRSFPGTCGPLDFTGKKLVGILGDTGAGKSTLLEAMTAALYGKCSWSEVGVAQLIAEGCAAMTVDFVFSVNGERWRVHRVFHTGTKPTQAVLENLRTGTAIDNVGGVNKRITQLLRLDYKSFKTAVLLPQGRFDALLNATDAERTTMLKSIFGVDEVQRIRARAEDGRDRLAELNHEAEVALARLLDDPVRAAEEAEADEHLATERADRLQDHLRVLRAGQEQAISAREHARALAAADVALGAHRVDDAPTVLADIRDTAAELDSRRHEFTVAHADARGRHDSCADTLRQAEDGGYTTTGLAAAGAILALAPQRMAALAQQRERLAGERDRLSTEYRAFTAERDRLDGLDRALVDLRERATRAAARTERARTAASRLRDAVRTALALGESAAGHRAARQEAHGRRQRLLDELDEHRGSVAALRAAGASAARTVLELQRGEAAFTAGEGLSPGDCCPVCRHTLTAGYAPPAPLGAHALDAARADADERARALARAVTAHDRVEVQVEQSGADCERHREQARVALGVLSEELGRVHEHAEALAAQTRAAAPAPELFATQLTDRVGATASRWAGGSLPEDSAEKGRLLEEVTAAAQARERYAVDDAAAAGNAAVEAAADLNASRRTLARRYEDIEREGALLVDGERRLAADQAEFAAQLTDLPDVARPRSQPADALPSPADITAAADAVTGQLARLEHLTRARDLAAAELHTLAAREQELTRQHHEGVRRPLQELGLRLRRWAESIDQAAGLVAEEHPLPVPDGATESDRAATEDYAAALRTAADRLHTSLTRVRTAALDVVTDFERTIAADPAAAQGSDEPDDALRVPATGSDVLSPALLDPLNRQVSAARSQADHARARLRVARSQIPHFTALGEALDAGRAQHSAWVGLCRHLTDAKFLAYLTERRTRSLLGIGSALLEQLSAGRLGFADNFRIVNRLTGTARGTKTLSGGETFLASLALSLALVELHGRSSTHLESLFLDEGFGTLDSGTLESALTVLRTHVAGDRLVTVISHLHQVAETVDDVLWVEKQSVGSTARWLTDRERATLVHHDIHGLSDLA